MHQLLGPHIYIFQFSFIPYNFVNEKCKSKLTLALPPPPPPRRKAAELCARVRPIS